MKILKTGINSAAKINYVKKISPDAVYRLSQYTYSYEENDRVLIQNTLTKEIIELTAKEWSAVKTLQNAVQDYDFIEKNNLTELARKRYIVESGYDEVKQYQQTVFVLKTMSGQKKGLFNYTIFPTTGCNARCIYCYEEGYEVKNMTSETAARLVEFICETRQNDKIKLHWFGGEPLSMPHIIRQICTGLQEHGVSYQSSMITNASLMTKELAHEAKTIWNLEEVQVSLDGTEQDYTLRKKYYNPDKHNYAVVMKSIHYLADEGIKVKLRVNVDFDNIERIGGFLESIKKEFGDMENISLYLAPLFQEQQGERCIELYKKIMQYNRQIRDLKTSSVQQDKKKLEFRLNYCMADSMDKSIVILPDGSFSNCEYLQDGNSWGNIFDGVTNQERFDELRRPVSVDAKCAKCPFLPICTPFYKKGCPCWFEKCYEYRCLSTEVLLHNLLKGENIEINDDDEKI